MSNWCAEQQLWAPCGVELQLLEPVIASSEQQSWSDNFLICFWRTSHHRQGCRLLRHRRHLRLILHRLVNVKMMQSDDGNWTYTVEICCHNAKTPSETQEINSKIGVKVVKPSLYFSDSIDTQTDLSDVASPLWTALRQVTETSSFF